MGANQSCSTESTHPTTNRLPLEFQSTTRISANHVQEGKLANYADHRLSPDAFSIKRNAMHALLVELLMLSRLTLTDTDVTHELYMRRFQGRENRELSIINYSEAFDSETLQSGIWVFAQGTTRGAPRES